MTLRAPLREDQRRGKGELLDLSSNSKSRSGFSLSKSQQLANPDRFQV